MSLLNALTIAGEARKLIDGLHTSEAEKKALELEFEKLNSALVLARLDVEKTQAQHASWFVAGARPALMWAGGAAVMWATFIRHLFDWIGGMAGAAFGFDYMPTPDVDLYEIMTALGVVTFESSRRTFEKTKGVSRDSLKPKGG